MNRVHRYPPRYWIGANEHAAGHNLTITQGEMNNTAKGSVWNTLSPQRHVYFPAGGAPTLTIGAAAGSGASITKIPSTLNDALLPLTLVSGTGPSTGTLFTINFHVTYPAGTIAAFFTPIDGLNGPVVMQMTAPQAGTGTTLVVQNAVAPAASTTYKFTVFVVGLY